MDNKRLILFAALFMILFMIWSAWQTEHPPAPAVASTNASATDVPTAPVSGSSTATKTDAPVPLTDAFIRGERIQVVTDLLNVTIDTNGGDLRDLRLRKHPVSTNAPQEPFQLLGDDSNVFVAQSGLIGEGENFPTHRTRFTAAQTHYALGETGNEIRVPLSFSSSDGMRYTKTYLFHRDSYAIDVEFSVSNGSKHEWKGYLYSQFQRSHVDGRQGLGMLGASSYSGVAIYTPQNKYEKVSFDDITKAPLKREAADAWIAILQHYFVGAWLPEKSERVLLYGAPVNSLYRAGYQQLDPTTVAVGATGTLRTRLYTGPKEHNRLVHLACASADLSQQGCDDNERTRALGMERTVDFGRLTVIAEPLFLLLKWIHQLLGNWGWSIVALTVLIKLVFYPLSAMSYKSMAKMRKVAPKMEAIKQQHANDRQQLNVAMMELYKSEKINPFGGCLPILIQIPVFISLYWVLLESVEMRQAPWILWIHDLSSKDPFYVLPLIMGATMYLQQKLSPQAPDPMQRKMFMLMPVIFTAMFLFFPAGLVLYWTVNNGLSILQQWRINTLIEGNPKKAG